MNRAQNMVWNFLKKISFQKRYVEKRLMNFLTIIKVNNLEDVSTIFPNVEMYLNTFFKTHVTFTNKL